MEAGTAGAATRSGDTRGEVPLPLRRSRQNPVLIGFYWEVNLLFQLNSDVLHSDWLPAFEINAAARNVKSKCFSVLK